MGLGQARLLKLVGGFLGLLGLGWVLVVAACVDIAHIAPCLARPAHCLILQPHAIQFRTGLHILLLALHLLSLKLPLAHPRPSPHSISIRTKTSRQIGIERRLTRRRAERLLLTVQILAGPRLHLIEGRIIALACTVVIADIAACARLGGWDR